MPTSGHILSVYRYLCCSHACSYVLQDVVSEVPAAKQLFQQASDILGYDLLNVCTEGKRGDNTMLQQRHCQLPALHHHLAASRSQRKARLHSSQPASHLCCQPRSFGEAQARRGAGLCTGLPYISQHVALLPASFQPCCPCRIALLSALCHKHLRHILVARLCRRLWMLQM